MAFEVMQPIVKSWLSKIRMAGEFKRTEFQEDADEAYAFFDGPHDFMYQGRYLSKSGSMYLGTDEGIPAPSFRMTVNKVAELVQLYGPYLYHRNPFRQVNLRRLPEFPWDIVGDPNTNIQAHQMAQQMQARQRSEAITAELLQYYLNYTPNELDLRGHARSMVDEALIKGMGIVWHEVYQPPGSGIRFAGSFYDTIDNLVADPDMERLMDCKWIARRRVLPRWEVEDRFGLPRNTLKGTLESANMQSEVVLPDHRDYQNRGDTNDLVEYWEVYSRMGVGHRLKGPHERFLEGLGGDLEILDTLGQYVYIAVCNEIDFPLNVPKDAWEALSFDEVYQRFQWPTPFWADPADPWPCTTLAFHERPRKLWPMSHIKPGLGELKFINWCFSFMADKIKNTSRDFIAIDKGVAEEIKTTILSGRDLSLLEIEKSHAATIRDVIEFVQHPPFNRDLSEVVQFALHLFEQRVGLDELMYGMTRKQMRSASEASLRGDMIRIRPDDMSEIVESVMTMVARKEALLARWHITEQDVVPILGPERAHLWPMTVQKSDIHAIIHEFEYRIEAGSIRKPNREKDVQDANEAIRVWMPLYNQYSMASNNFNPVNGLIGMWAKAMDLPPESMQLQPIQPNPEQQQMQQQMAQMEQQLKQQEAQLKQQEAIQKLELARALGLQKLEQENQKHQITMAEEVERHVLDMLKSRTTHLQEMQQSEQQHDQEMEQKEKETDAKIRAASVRASKPRPKGAK